MSKKMNLGFKNIKTICRKKVRGRQEEMLLCNDLIVFVDFYTKQKAWDCKSSTMERSNRD